MKNAQFPTMEEPSALDSAHCTDEKAQLKLTPRENRVLTALLDTAGCTSREDVDRIAGASNGPAIIAALRRKVTGHDGIVTERVEVVDRDGQAARPGLYRLSTGGRYKARVFQRQLSEAA